MSTAINQYFMYGILVPFTWYKEWEKETGKDFHETFEKYLEESHDNRLVYNEEGIFCLFDGRDGRFIIIGQVLLKSNDDDLLGNDEPISIPKFDIVDELLIQASIEEHFGLKGEFNYYFVTKYH
jgi:hypothetical protein